MAGHDYVGKYTLKTNLDTESTLMLGENTSFQLQDTSGTVVESIVVPTGASKLPFSVMLKPAEAGETTLSIQLKIGDQEASSLFERNLTAKPSESKIIEDEKEKLSPDGEYMAGHDYVGKYTLKTNLVTTALLSLGENSSLTLQNVEGETVENLYVPIGASQLPFSVTFRPTSSIATPFIIKLKIGEQEPITLLDRTLIVQNDAANEFNKPKDDFVESIVQGTIEKDLPKVMKVGEQVEVICSFINTGRKPVTETELTTEIDENDV